MARKCKPYLEADLAVPLNVYGNTKLAGEFFIRATTPRYFILRTSALFGTHPCRAKGGRNFVDLMLKARRRARDEVRVVNDEFVTPTFTGDVARQITVLSRSEQFGLYHGNCRGKLFVGTNSQRLYSMLLRRKPISRLLPQTKFPAKVPRPKYSVLENHELKKRGLNSFRAWEAGLQSYLHSFGLLELY